MNNNSNLASKGTGSLMIDSPVFLIGAERSGTTLLRLILDHHPVVAFQHEFELSVKYLPASGWPDMRTYCDQLACDRNFTHSKYSIDPSLDYPHLVNDFLLQKQRASGSKPVIGATVHYQFSNLTRIWPNARFIHIIRDGRDVARSMVQMGWFGNSWNSCVEWVSAEHEIDNFRPGFLMLVGLTCNTNLCWKMLAVNSIESASSSVSNLMKPCFPMRMTRPMSP